MTENEMTNQAAQTMPTLPRPYWKAGDVKDDYGNPYNETDLFTDDDMRAMYQQGYAAALSQTAGVVEGWKLVPVEPTAAMCDAMRISVGDGIAMKPVYRAMLAAAPAASGGEPPSAASVSERARTASLKEIVPAEKRNYLDDNGNPRSIEDEAYAHGWNACRAATIRTLEQALTQQRGEASYDAGMAMHWIERYAAGIDEECQLDRIAEAFTTPQPSADAVRELVEALQVAELALRERGLSACGEYKQIAAAIAKATNHQQNAAQGGKE